MFKSKEMIKNAIFGIDIEFAISFSWFFVLANAQIQKQGVYIRTSLTEIGFFPDPLKVTIRQYIGKTLKKLRRVGVNRYNAAKSKRAKKCKFISLVEYGRFSENSDFFNLLAF